MVLEECKTVKDMLSQETLYRGTVLKGSIVVDRPSHLKYNVSNVIGKETIRVVGQRPGRSQSRIVVKFNAATRRSVLETKEYLGGEVRVELIRDCDIPESLIIGDEIAFEYYHINEEMPIVISWVPWQVYVHHLEKLFESYNSLSKG
jgi:hypothetical protein